MSSSRRTHRGPPPAAHTNNEPDPLESKQTLQEKKREQLSRLEEKTKSLATPKVPAPSAPKVQLTYLQAAAAANSRQSATQPSPSTSPARRPSDLTTLAILRHRISAVKSPAKLAPSRTRSPSKSNTSNSTRPITPTKPHSSITQPRPQGIVAERIAAYSNRTTQKSPRSRSNSSGHSHNTSSYRAVSPSYHDAASNRSPITRSTTTVGVPPSNSSYHNSSSRQGSGVTSNYRPAYTATRPSADSRSLARSTTMAPSVAQRASNRDRVAGVSAVAGAGASAAILPHVAVTAPASLPTLTVLPSRKGSAFDVITQLPRGPSPRAISAPSLNTQPQHAMTGFRLKAPLFETCQSLFVHVQGHQVMVWDLHNEEVVTVFDGHTADIRSISCLALPTGIMVCTSSYEVTLLWDAVSGTVLNDLPAARTAVLYRHDSRIRAMLAVKDTIQVWDFNGTAKAAISTLSGHKADVTAIALIVPPSSTSSLRLGRPRLTALSASEDGTMKAWSLDKGECEYTIEGAGQIDTLSVADARFAVSMSGQEKTLKVWDLRSNYRCAFQQSTLSASDGDSIPQLISLAIEDTTPDPTKDGKLVKLWKTARKDKEIFRFFVDEPANYVYIEPRQVLIGSADGSPFFSYKAR